MLRRIGVPEERQRIFQSHAAALEEAKRSKGVALAVAFAVAQDLANGHLRPARRARSCRPRARWHVLTLADRDAPPVGGRADAGS